MNDAGAARHALPAEVFADLARGEGGGRAIRLLRSAEHSRRVLLLWSVVEEARSRRHPAATVAVDGYAALADIQRRAPDAARTAVEAPSTGVWAQLTLHEFWRGSPTVRPERLATLAGSAAVLAGARRSVMMLAEDDGVTLPGVGRAVLPGARFGRATEVRRGGDHVEIVSDGIRVVVPGDPRAETENWQPLRRARLRDDIVVDDVDEYRFAADVELHPRLTGAELARWRGSVAAGWRLLAGDHPGMAEEVAECVTTVVPLSTRGAEVSSATAPAAFGAVALGFPRDAVTAAAILAHEVQHAKLAALMHLYDFTDGPPDRRYYAPWRDDPRPLPGLLHGAYAHLGVARFWRARRERADSRQAVFDAEVRFARWRDAALEVTRFLADGGMLTGLGGRLVGGMLSVLEEWEREPVPAGALARAREVAERHRTGWAERNAGGS
ncbi:HEXXH motif domain-containing protein [Microtetraspora sp. NBRC 13810]|uniref:HEXXH motif domain-containing protein n=1 Tax=Microtetraspora sp. NBRC 13810 TaxID=3030990 RepID=UPI0024A403AA|nr:HEXXH motif domain-containing protein [Microtetraspora sp. NBRC 13810]GLW12836.1 HEXXH motif domain-containing protein [Microtetraspora sp. NBRC 13810]